MREFWIPAARADELPTPGGAPIRIKLLGEKLVVIRDPKGALGVFRHQCPHRGASLFYGRNEIGGIRCVYHGWKFKMDGSCVEMPSEPNGEELCKRVKATAYPVQQKLGVVWVFLGSRRPLPPLPELSPFMSDEVDVRFIHLDCNWMRCLEGDIDTAHLTFLHLGSVAPAVDSPESFSSIVLNNRAAKYEACETPYGTMYGARRPAGIGKSYWRIAHFMHPFYTAPPVGVLGVSRVVRAWIPLDNENTMLAMFRAAADVPMSEMLSYEPRTSDWLGRWRLKQSKENDYGIDRDLQMSSSFSGVQGNLLQDRLASESIGTLAEMPSENLMPSDAMIVLTRRRLAETIKKYDEHRIAPECVSESASRICGGGAIIPDEADWKSFVNRRLRGEGATPEERIGDVLALEGKSASCVELTIPVTNWHEADTVDGIARFAIAKALELELSDMVIRLQLDYESLTSARLTMRESLEAYPTCKRIYWSNGVSRWCALYQTADTELALEWQMEHQS